jgi:hypothetical protein
VNSRCGPSAAAVFGLANLDGGFFARRLGARVAAPDRALRDLRVRVFDVAMAALPPDERS